MMNDDENEIVSVSFSSSFAPCACKNKKIQILKTRLDFDAKFLETRKKKRDSLRENKKRREKRAVAIQNKKNCYIQLST